MFTTMPEPAQRRLTLLLDAAREHHTDQLAVVWRGEAREWCFSDADGPLHVQSVTKSVVNLIVGRLVTLGHLGSIDEPVHRLYPEWRQGRKRLITVRMLLEHTSGLQNVAMATEEVNPSPDVVQLALCAELDAEPGTVWAYNNKAVNLLAGIVERASGRKLDAFARDELFGPMGIEGFAWERDQAGNPRASGGLLMRAADLAKLGQLVLQRGEWRGRRLVAEAWFAEMERRAGEGDESTLLWLQLFDDTTGERLAYRAEGDMGGYLLAFPLRQLVVVRLVGEATARRLDPLWDTPPTTYRAFLERRAAFLFPGFYTLASELAAAIGGRVTTAP